MNYKPGFDPTSEAMRRKDAQDAEDRRVVLAEQERCLSCGTTLEHGRFGANCPKCAPGSRPAQG